jgi:hypothetical protein
MNNFIRPFVRLGRCKGDQEGRAGEFRAGKSPVML